MTRRLTGLLCGAITAAAVVAVLLRCGGPRWTRRNYRGREVSLAAGPALALGALTGAAAAGGDRRLLLATCLAVGPAALAGGYDDLAGSAAARGFGGHLGALGRGTLTTGVVKIVGIGVGAVAAAGLVDTRPVTRVATTAGLVAGAANLLNLLDLRPGRAGKVGLLLAAPVLAGPRPLPVVGATGAVAVLLPADLRERVMLGDAGANALGAAVGLGLATTARPRLRAALLAVVVALTLASERVSFSRVIDDRPALRWLDRLGQATAATEPDGRRRGGG